MREIRPRGRLSGLSGLSSSASDRKVGSNPSSPWLSWAACRSALEEDTESQLAPDAQLAPRMAASAISEGPAMSWRLAKGVRCPRPETAGIGSCDPIKGIKLLQTIDGWMESDQVVMLALCPAEIWDVSVVYSKSKGGHSWYKVEPECIHKVDIFCSYPFKYGYETLSYN